MLKITIFQGYNPEQDILNALKADGLVGISGGRLEVREKLKKVQDLINSEGCKTYHAQSTINHPETELGYAFDEERFSLQEAQKLVAKSYESKTT